MVRKITILRDLFFKLTEPNIIPKENTYKPFFGFLDIRF